MFTSQSRTHSIGNHETGVEMVAPVSFVKCLGFLTLKSFASHGSICRDPRTLPSARADFKD